MSSHNVIRVKSYSDNQEEGTLTVAATPGMLLERHTAEGSFKPQTSVGGAVQRAFCLEDNLQGETIDDEIAIGGKVQVLFTYPGDQINALVALDETIAIGDKMISNGDGTLKKAASEIGQQLVGIALEAVDTTDSLVVAAQRLLIQTF